MLKQFENQRQIEVLDGNDHTKKIVVTHTEIGGAPRIDIRENIVNEKGELVPTRKGINLTTKQAASITHELYAFIDEFDSLAKYFCVYDGNGDEIPQEIEDDSEKDGEQSSCPDDLKDNDFGTLMDLNDGSDNNMN